MLQVWPIANTIAFRYIPQDLRIIYQNVLGVAMVNAASRPPCSSRSKTALWHLRNESASCRRLVCEPLQGTYVSLLTSGSLG